MLDNFSEQSAEYAQYRPTFPERLIQELAGMTDPDLAWDIGTGNGQVAALLARHFHQVVATDMSQQQLDQAVKAENIVYIKEPAEDSSLEDHSVNMATVAQAIHWFDFNPFYKEVRRVLVPGGVLAVLGYGEMETGTAIDEVYNRFHKNILSEFWDPQRRYVDEGYRTIPFPFEEITLKGQYRIERSWTLSDLMGYFSSWSAVRHYIRDRNQDPIALIVSDLRHAWPAGTDHLQVRFPVFARVGRTK